MPQLNLNFLDISIPETHLWEQFGRRAKASRDRDPGAPSHPGDSLPASGAEQ